MALEQVIRQDWWEYDDWGQSPGGYSYHTNHDSLNKFIKHELARNTSTYALQPRGTSYRVGVDEKTYERVQESKNGTWEA